MSEDINSQDINPELMNLDARASEMARIAKQLARGYDKQALDNFCKLCCHHAHFYRPDMVMEIFDNLCAKKQTHAIRMFLNIPARFMLERDPMAFFHAARKNGMDQLFLHDIHDLLPKERRAQYLYDTMMIMARQDERELLYFHFHSFHHVDDAGNAIALQLLREGKHGKVIDNLFRQGLDHNAFLYHAARKLAQEDIDAFWVSPSPLEMLRPLYFAMENDKRFGITVDRIAMHAAVARAVYKDSIKNKTSPDEIQTLTLQRIGAFYDEMASYYTSAAAHRWRLQKARLLAKTKGNYMIKPGKVGDPASENAASTLKSRESKSGESKSGASKTSTPEPAQNPNAQNPNAQNANAQNPNAQNPDTAKSSTPESSLPKPSAATPQSRAPRKPGPRPS